MTRNIRGARRRIAWFVAVPTLTLVAAAVWWYARGAESVEGARDADVKVKSAASGASDSKVRYVRGLARERTFLAYEKLIEFYARSARDPSALDARKIALDALFDERVLGLKLERVLRAVQADPTPPEEDPLWSHLVGRLAELWTPETFDKGRDLMLMHDKPRARRALVGSLLDVTNSRIGSLTPEQRMALSGDFVDAYAQADPTQRPDILAALGRLTGNNDLADVLGGRVLDSNFRLQAEVAQERMLEQTARELAKTTAPIGEDQL